MQNHLTLTAMTGAGLEPYTGEWGDRQIMHLLRRTLFGVTKEDLDQFRELNLAEAVNALLQYSPIPDPPINDYYDETDEEPAGEGETWINEDYDNNLEGGSYRFIKAASDYQYD